MKYEEWLRVIKIVSDGAKNDGTTLNRDQCCRLREYFDANRRALCGESPSSPSSRDLDDAVKAVMACATEAQVRDQLSAFIPASPSSAGQEVREAVREALTKLADEGTRRLEPIAGAAFYTDVSRWRDREYPALSAGETETRTDVKAL